MKPMLSASLDGIPLETLRYPLFVSPKLDGVRALVLDGTVYSRNMKPIRNKHVQKLFMNLHGLDGELIVGSPTDGHVLNRTQSGVMSFDGEPDVRLHVFDSIGDAFAGESFRRRYDYLFTGQADTYDSIQIVEHHEVFSPEQALALEQRYLEMGYEGIMLRDPNGPYKEGRSTLREGYLMKLKRFMDGEGEVASLEEGRHNENELTRDELGRAKRSKHQENLTGAGMVGSIILKDGMRLSPGIMTHAERGFYWEHPEQLVGKIVHWRAFGYGALNTPRFPRYYGIRTL